MIQTPQDYLAQFLKVSQMIPYKEKELAEFVSNFLGQIQSFLNEVAYYKEKLLMDEFYEKNGFAATDDDAKRALLYEICNEIDYPYPTTDDERNEIIQMGDSTEWTDMMRIGWHPSY